MDQTRRREEATLIVPTHSMQLLSMSEQIDDLPAADLS